MTGCLLIESVSYIDTEMKILGQIAFLLMLGGMWCQNPNAKVSGKSSKRTGGTSAEDVAQSAPVVDLTVGSTGGSGSARGSGGTRGSAGAGTTGNTRGTAGATGRASGGGSSGRGNGGAAGSEGVGATGSTKVTAGAGGSEGSRSTGSTRGSGGTAEAGARSAGQQTDDMRLQFLKNTQVTCNDGTAAG